MRRRRNGTPTAQSIATAAPASLVSVHRRFIHPSAVIDAYDLVILSSTSRNAANQHDADLCTIHRIPNLRVLPSTTAAWRPGHVTLSSPGTPTTANCQLPSVYT
ncbi:MAG: hypothetical protein OXG65_00050 [Chloroflexi bacterium]|nr:hypothetical protein [Chloroflexota bacterium]